MFTDLMHIFFILHNSNKIFTVHSWLVGYVCYYSLLKYGMVIFRSMSNMCKTLIWLLKSKQT